MAYRSPGEASNYDPLVNRALSCVHCLIPIQQSVLSVSWIKCLMDWRIEQPLFNESSFSKAFLACTLPTLAKRCLPKDNVAKEMNIHAETRRVLLQRKRIRSE